MGKLLLPQIEAPVPRPVTFTVDHAEGTLRLVDEWWPARILIDGGLIALAKQGQCRGLTFDRTDDDCYFVSPLVARFTLANASATYREVGRSGFTDDVYEFDCISCSRDMTDG